MRCTAKRAQTIVKGFEKISQAYEAKEEYSRSELTAPYYTKTEMGNEYTHLFDGTRVMKIKGKLKDDLPEYPDKLDDFRRKIKAGYEMTLPSITALKRYMKENKITPTSPVWKQTYKLLCGVTVQCSYLLEALELTDDPKGYFDRYSVLSPIKIVDDWNFVGLCPVRLKDDMLAYNERVEKQKLVTIEAVKAAVDTDNSNFRFWYEGEMYMFSDKTLDEKTHLPKMYRDWYEVQTTSTNPHYKKLSYMDEVWIDR